MTPAAIALVKSVIVVIMGCIGVFLGYYASLKVEAIYEQAKKDAE